MSGREKYLIVLNRIPMEASEKVLLLGDSVNTGSDRKMIQGRVQANPLQRAHLNSRKILSSYNGFFSFAHLWYLD